MSNDFISFLGFVSLMGLLLIRVPVGIAMGFVGVTGYMTIVGWWPGLNLLVNSPLRTAIDYNFSVLPMFILMGVLASGSGMSMEIYRAGRAWFGHLQGGLALSTIVACGGFSAINGSAIATTATMTTIALPEMRRSGYAPGPSAGVIAAGGTLGIMIPPSVVFLLYGILTDQDIGRLFMAGVLPGMLAIVLYIITIQIMARVSPTTFPRMARASSEERWQSLQGIWATALLFLIVVVSIYWGFATITESAAIGAVGAFVIGVARRRLMFSATMMALVEALRISASIFTIAIGAYLFGYFLTVTQTTQNLTSFLTGLPVGPYTVLALILLVYLVLGALMDELAMILLTVPIVFPAIVALGFDPIWFGVILVMTVTLGLTMPPIGMNVFVIKAQAQDLSLGMIYRGTAPFILADLVRLAILVLFPAISLFLPSTMN